MVMAKWMNTIKYSPEIEAELASGGAAAFRDSRIAMLEGAGYTVHGWWVSGDPDWDAVFMLEGDYDPAAFAKIQLTVKGNGSAVAAKVIPIADAEDVDAAG